MDQGRTVKKVFERKPGGEVKEGEEQE